MVRDRVVQGIQADAVARVRRDLQSLEPLALDRMQESDLLSRKDRQNAEYLAWSTVHGLALLVLEGPLYKMPREMVVMLGKRLVIMVERGLGFSPIKEKGSGGIIS